MSQIRTNSIVPASGVPSGASGGGIIQTKIIDPGQLSISSISIGYGDNMTTTNTVSAFTGTITPTSSSNKILIDAYIAGDMNGYLAEEFWGLFNGSTLLATSSWYRRGRDQEPFHYRLVAIHSPGSTSTQTYDFRCAFSSGNTHYINRSSGYTTTNWRYSTTALLMEISA